MMDGWMDVGGIRLGVIYICTHVEAERVSALVRLAQLCAEYDIYIITIIIVYE